MSSQVCSLNIPSPGIKSPVVYYQFRDELGVQRTIEAKAFGYNGCEYALVGAGRLNPLHRMKIIHRFLKLKDEHPEAVHIVNKPSPNFINPYSLIYC